MNHASSWVKTGCHTVEQGAFLVVQYHYGSPSMPLNAARRKLITSPATTIGRAESRGFTLVEWLIIVAVVGILAAAAFPVYKTYTI
ncbi:MAG: prepilin-type N-terminal cleavage/methylation domain-containing protein, partial [Sterolibacterium sp.]